MLLDMESRTLDLETPSRGHAVGASRVSSMGRDQSPVGPKESLRSREPKGAVHEPKGKEAVPAGTPA